MQLFYNFLALWFSLLYNYRIVIPVVAVAQLVEHRIVIPSVAGSSPVGHPNLTSRPNDILLRMSDKKATAYIGINFGGHHAGVCLIQNKTIQLALTERFSRIKGAGGWPTKELLKIKELARRSQTFYAENTYEGCRAVPPPHVDSLTHHLCHAYSALAVSPFSKAVIVVLDGAGNHSSHFRTASDERSCETIGSLSSGLEACSVYLQNGSTLSCVLKEWQATRKAPFEDKTFYFGSGVGLFYEASARYIFNSRFEAGKVMGLAALGQPRQVRNRLLASQRWNWSHAFLQKGKKAWEKRALTRLRKDASLAATVQAEYELTLTQLLISIRNRYPKYTNLILTGGCALNCVANTKIHQSKIFRNIFVPPFPGDEGIALGAAEFLRVREEKGRWKPKPMAQQTACFGMLSSRPNNKRTREVFTGYRIKAPKNLADTVARHLERGSLVGWYQGRSESGPRALGHRSILASPLRAGLKNHLNQSIKQREFFRPYGSSCLIDKAHIYFDVNKGFESPFMSFAPKIRTKYRELLNEVSHVDGTSRIQTVRWEQDRRFYNLIKSFGDRTGLYCLLNTSMNVMGQPIVETIEDAYHFFESTPIDILVIGDLIIHRRPHNS
jgi:carbamoyltransferase